MEKRVFQRGRSKEYQKYSVQCKGKRGECRVELGACD